MTFLVLLIIFLLVFGGIIYPIIAGAARAELRRRIQTQEIQLRELEKSLRALEAARDSGTDGESKASIDASEAPPEIGARDSADDEDGIAAAMSAAKASAAGERQPPPLQAVRAESDEPAAEPQPESPADSESEGKRDDEETETIPPIAASASSAQPLPPKTTPPPPPQTASLPPRNPVATGNIAGTAATAASAPPPSPAAQSIPWRRILEAMQLLPPASSDDTAEVRLATWWTTRIGSVVLVIAGVFLGVYVSQDSPVLRLACLGAIAAAVVGAGCWLEKRYEAFGRVVTASGLGLVFVTAFAASAFETTRVITSPILGVLTQAGTVAAMMAWSLWRKDRVIATLALICGYVACAFSHHHDLGPHLVAGLLLLAAAGAGVLVLRRWPAPPMVALAGSWGGFLGLVVFDWRASVSAAGIADPGVPGPWLLLGCLLALMLIFHAAAVAFQLSYPEHAGSTRLRRGMLVNTSLAVVTAYFAGRMIHPEHLASYYLSFAVTVFGLAAWHIQAGKTHDTGLSRTLFLKSMALLALFIVARFDGPVRWLSLALQTAALLYTWHRHRNPWIQLGFAVGLVGTLGWIWIDLLRLDWPEWSITGARQWVGALVVLLLTGCLAAHAHLMQRERHGEDGEEVSQSTDAVILRLLGALGIVSVALAIAFIGRESAFGIEVPRLTYLTLLAPLAMAPLAIWRSLPPIVSGGLTLLAAGCLYLAVDSEDGQSLGALILGQCLILAAFGCAEWVGRAWPKRWAAGELPRSISYAMGLLLLLATLLRVAERFDWSTGGMAAATLGFGLVVAGTLLAHTRPLRSSLTDDIVDDTVRSAPHAGRWLASLAGGFGLIFLSRSWFSGTPLDIFWLALASVAPLLSAYRTRNPVPVAAGGTALVAAWVLAFRSFDDPGIALGSSVIAGLGILTINGVIAWCLNRAFAPDGKGRSGFLPYETALHLATLILGWRMIDTWLVPAGAMAASVAAALAAMALARLLSLRRLAELSAVPILLAAVRHVFDVGWRTAPEATFGWWLALAGLVAYVAVFALFYRRSTSADLALASGLLHLVTWTATACSILVLRAALTDPWHAVGFIAVALLGAAVARGARFSHLLFATALPATAALVAALRLGILGSTASPGSIRTACLLVAAGILALGVIAFARRPARDQNLAPLTAILGTGLAFAVFISPRLGVENLTTVCWGVTAIAVFIAGLAGGLKSYRLVGLVGLGLCLLRIFIVDINDTFHRIIASFVVALVLFATGFLYHRFRHVINTFDQGTDEDAPPGVGNDDRKEDVSS